MGAFGLVRGGPSFLADQGSSDRTPAAPQSSGGS
jgi:hypothetical protein